MRYLCFLLTLVGASVWGEPQPSAKRVLDEFNQTPAFLNADPDRKRLIGELSSACEVEISQCLQLIASNPTLVIAATPDNPLYWARYEAVLHSGPIPRTDLEPRNSTSTWSNRHGLLFDSTRNLWAREVALNGSLNLERVIRHTLAIRKRISQSRTIVERMINIANLGVVNQPTNLAMAQAALTGRDDVWPMFAEALTPMSTEELSYRNIFNAELRYSAQQMQKENGDQTSVNPADAKWPRHPPPTESERYAEWVWYEQYLADFETASKQMSNISEMNAADFWGARKQQTLAQLFQQFDETTTPVPVLNDYIHTDRLMNLSLHLMRAALDIYRGNNSSGVPERPAPVHWRWQWRHATSDLCLMPTTAATDIDEMCQHIWRRDELAGAFRHL